MESIGNMLRTERERKGLTVQDVFDSTRITLPNIEALEQDRFESFPNKVYARAFLRDYANFLDMDSMELLRRYEEEWCTVQPQVETKHTEKQHKSYAWAWVLAVLIIFAAGGYYYWLTNYSGQNDIPFSPSIPTINADKELPAIESPIIPHVQPADEPPVNIPPPPQPVTGLSLSVTALQTVWIRVVSDGKVLYQQNLNAGQTKTWTANSIFVVRSGMMHAVQVKLNGVPVKLQPKNRSRHPIGIGTFKLKDVKPAPATPQQ